MARTVVVKREWQVNRSISHCHNITGRRPVQLGESNAAIATASDQRLYRYGPFCYSIFRQLICRLCSEALNVARVALSSSCLLA